jgi:hypothetical protein
MSSVFLNTIKRYLKGQLSRSFVYKYLTHRGYEVFFGKRMIGLWSDTSYTEFTIQYNNTLLIK